MDEHNSVVYKRDYNFFFLVTDRSCASLLSGLLGGRDCGGVADRDFIPKPPTWFFRGTNSTTLLIIFFFLSFFFFIPLGNKVYEGFGTFSGILFNDNFTQFFYREFITRSLNFISRVFHFFSQQFLQSGILFLFFSR